MGSLDVYFVSPQKSLSHSKWKIKTKGFFFFKEESNDAFYPKPDSVKKKIKKAREREKAGNKKRNKRNHQQNLYSILGTHLYKTISNGLTL